MELRGLGLYNDISGQDPEERCVAQWLFFQSSELSVVYLTCIQSQMFLLKSLWELKNRNERDICCYAASIELYN